MTIRARLLAVSLVVPLTAGAGLLAAGSAAADTTPSVTMSNAGGADALGDAVLAPGDTSTITGSGFTPSTKVKITPPTGYGASISAEVTAAGTFSTRYTVPAKAKSGSVTLIAVDQQKAPAGSAVAGGGGGQSSLLYMPPVATADYTVIPADHNGGSASGAGGGSPLSGGGGGLAYTGTNIVLPLEIATALLIVGSGLVIVGSRRRIAPITVRNASPTT